MTVQQVRAEIDTGLSDDALYELIQRADGEIAWWAGDADEQVDRLEDEERDTKVMYLSRRAGSITSVKERGARSEDWTTLSANDYELVPSGMRLDRLPDGDNGRTYWGDQVEVTYVPYDREKRRDAVLIDLIKLSLSFAGVDSERLPDYSYTRSTPYEEQRQEILSRLSERPWA